jgi:rhodanese-related sulfurtransferase
MRTWKTHRLKTCAPGDSEGGYRSAIAASLLQKLGCSETRDLVGGFKAWLAAKLPTAM